MFAKRKMLPFAGNQFPAETLSDSFTDRVNLAHSTFYIAGMESSELIMAVPCLVTQIFHLWIEI
jgi:hypothetical protein